MTLDDVEGIFNKAAFDGECQFGGLDHRAGIRAVVEALRDACYGCEHHLMWDEILASDGVDKAAGKDTAAQPEAIERSAPAAAPVCEWTDGGEHWETSCGDRTFHWSSVQGKIVCHVCGKLIEFKDTSK